MTHLVGVESLSVNDLASAPSKGQLWTGRILAGLVVAVMCFSASFKLLQPGDFAANWSQNYPLGAARPIGIAEVTCAILYAIPRTRILGGLLVVGYLGGAVATHVHLGQWIFVLPFTLGVLAWLSLWLRDPRLRRFMPLTRDD